MQTKENNVRVEIEDLKYKLLNYLNYIPLFIIGLIITIGIFYYSYEVSERIYSVEAKVHIKNQMVSPVEGLFNAPGMLKQSSSSFNNEIYILTTFSLHRQVVEDLNLQVGFYRTKFNRFIPIEDSSPVIIDVDWSNPQILNGMFELEVIDNNRFKLSLAKDDTNLYNPTGISVQEIIDKEELFEEEYFFGKPVKSLFFNFKVESLGLEQGDKVYFNFKSIQEVTYSYLNRFEVGKVGRFESDILLAQLKTSNKSIGRNYLNRLLEIYLNKELDEKNRAFKNTISFIDFQLNEITDSLNYIESNLQDYRSENKIFDLSSEGAAVFGKLADLEKEKRDADFRENFYVSTLEYLLKNSNEEIISPSVYGIQDPTIVALAGRINELQAEKVRLSAFFAEETPTVREVTNRIVVAKKTLIENINSARSQNSTLLNAINAQIKERELQINLLPETERRLIGLERKFNLNEGIFIFLQQRRAEAAITLASNLPSNIILESALIRPGLIEPDLTKLIAYHFGAFFLIFIAYVEIKSLLQTKIVKKLDLQKKLNFPILGMIPRANKKNSIPVFEDPKSVNTESFRNIRSDINFLIPSKKNLTVLVTSSISGEGKTYVSCNLAAIYALSGKRVVLIGADLRKPKLAQYFGITNKEKGLSNYLMYNASLEEIIKPTVSENLDLILSGTVPPNPAELLLSTRFNDFILNLKNDYDIIVIDSPPTSLVSETREILQFSDLNIVVFRQGYSEKHSIDFWNEFTEMSKQKNFYSLFNDVHLKGGYGYSYGYGRGYGYGYGYLDGKNYGYLSVQEVSKWKKLREKIFSK